MNCKGLEYDLHKAQKGDEELQLMLIKEYMPYIKKHAKTYKIKGYNYQDLIQLGSLAMLKAIYKYKIGSNTFKGYALRTIKNAFAYVGRESKYQWKECLFSKENVHSETMCFKVLDYENVIEENIIYREEIAELRNGILKLHPEEKRFINLIFYENLTLKQLAQEEFISYNQAVRRKNRIIRKLKEIYTYQITSKKV